MENLLHLSLLLATTQLPLVSARVVHLREGSNAIFKFPPQGKVTYCPSDCVGCECVMGLGGSRPPSFRQVKVDERPVTITNLRANDTCTYFNYNASSGCNGTVELSVGGGCIRNISHFDFSEGYYRKLKLSDEAKCRRNCTQDPHCQYFTFDTSHFPGQCFLMSSEVNVMIQLNRNTVSGYSRRNCTALRSSQDYSGLQFHLQKKSWIGALEHCLNNRSSLVQINDTTVQQKVDHLLSDKDIEEGVWIGLERSIFGTDLDWKWVSGDTLEDPVAPWNSSFVDPLNNHCGKIIKVNGTLMWVNANCHDELPFICQHSGSNTAA
ncbi:uncharacterized protein LOC131970514 [Centropristis striata]|uniref:uncharacterized protein LOC131970514 n=1 Tax=Centropristis striata TaxID=184440 RepID=UPI0027E0FF4C|nr:uncharacterized protein LOC131970514 [Centropristis striata]